MAWGMLCWEGAREAWTRWTDGKNSFGRAPLGGSGTEATPGWTHGKLSGNCEFAKF